jgi:hypothetical protein
MHQHKSYIITASTWWQVTGMHLEAEVRESKAQKQAHPRGMIMSATPPTPDPNLASKMPQKINAMPLT